MNDSYELMIAEVAGHEARSLTPDIDPTIHEDVLEFRWSPDGQSIAYLKDDDVDGNQIFVVNVNSKESNAHRISGEATYSDIDPDNGSIDAVINDFRWSPDSSAIAFIGHMEDHTLLYLADAITENRMEIDVSGISLQGGIDSFAWSPDGSQIAMIERLDDLDNEALSLVDAKTGSWQTLVNYEDGVNGFFGFSVPRYSPDGQYIAFVAEDSVSGVAHLHVVSTDKSSLRRVSGDTSEATAEVSEFEWSPDGKSLAFIGNFETADNDELFVVGRDTEVNGNDRRKISGSLTDLDTPPDGSLNGDVEEFEWSPDGEQIAFVGQDLKGEFDKEIFIVAVSGDSNDRRLVSGASTDHNGDGIPDSWFNEIRWSPAGTHLYFKGNVQDVDADGLFKVAADSTDGGDRVSVSGPVAPEGGVVSEYDVGGPSN